MAKRWPNWRLVKAHQAYTVEEVAKLFGKHEQTVRNWVKSGLAVIDDRRPQLILGSILAEFLRTKRQAGRKKCGPGEFYCLKCGEPRAPAGNMADYVSMTAASGNLRALCPICTTLMHRRVGHAGLTVLTQLLDISFPDGARQLNDRTEPCGNSDFEGRENP
jgi:hypothetical protein